jgi:hypothetical protein
LTAVALPVSAFSEATHKIINLEAARSSNMHRTLNSLGFRLGLATQFKHMTALEWVGEGGEREDAPFCRSARHFHDPLKPWDQAGLVPHNLLVSLGCGGTEFESSLVWSQKDAQDPTGSLKGTWSWPEARKHFYGALASSSATDREGRWADTLRAVGHAMHFVEDASVPEHVRNDTHIHEAALRYVGIHGYGNYESWVADEHNNDKKLATLVQTYLSAPSLPDRVVLAQGTGDSTVPVPIARLIDTNRYTGADPNVTKSGPIGIAEFANANFFSKDTGDGKAYPFPKRRALVGVTLMTPSERHVRRYYRKDLLDGVPVVPVLAECVFDQAALAAGIPAPEVTCADKNVWKAVAAIMLPQALGYATAALDYFFRGRLGVQVERRGQVLGLRITNLTPDERMEGVFNLYYDTSNDQRSLLTSWFLGLDSQAQSDFLPFPTPPKGFKGYALLFEGTLGLESGAIAGRVFDPVPGAYIFMLGREVMPEGTSDFRTLGVLEIPTPVAAADFGSFIMKYRAGPETQESHVTGYLYRALYESPGDTLRLGPYLGGTGCVALEYDGATNAPTIFLGSLGPAAVDIFEAETPTSVTDLEEFTYSSPPVEVRKLRPSPVQATDGMLPAEIRISGVRLLGVRVVTEPPFPALPFVGQRVNQCSGYWLVDVVP